MFNIDEIINEVEINRQKSEQFLDNLVEKSLKWFEETGSLWLRIDNQETINKCYVYENYLEQKNLKIINNSNSYGKSCFLIPKVLTVDYVNRDTNIFPSIVNKLKKELVMNFEDDNVDTFTIYDIGRTYFNSDKTDVLPALVDYFKNQSYIFVYLNYDNKVNIGFNKKEYLRINQYSK